MKILSFLICTLLIVSTSHAGDYATITSGAIVDGQLWLSWNVATNRFVLEEINLSDGQLTAAAEAGNAITDEYTISLNNQIGIYRLRLGVLIAKFTSPVLESYVRSILDLPTDTTPLYDTDLLNLNTLQLSYAGLEQLNGLEDALNLQTLTVAANQLTDLNLLTHLAKLEYLELGANSISDITPIANLNNLVALSLNDNNISDLSPLAGLANLRLLDVSGNVLTSLETLPQLPGLRELYADHNALETTIGITQPGHPLDKLDLSHNNITDITPLLNGAINGGFSPDATVYLSGNPLANESQVVTLRSYGIDVFYP